MSPCYEYVCSCGQVTEVFRRIHDRDKPVNCECGKKAELQMSVTSKPVIEWGVDYG